MSCYARLRACMRRISSMDSVPQTYSRTTQNCARHGPGTMTITSIGRPIAFYQQLQRLNLEREWAKVRVPTLVMHGQYDWIMSRSDFDPGAAEMIGNWIKEHN